MKPSRAKQMWRLLKIPAYDVADAGWDMEELHRKINQLVWH